MPTPTDLTRFVMFGKLPDDEPEEHGPSDADLPTAADIEDRRISGSRSLVETGQSHLVPKGR